MPKDCLLITRSNKHSGFPLPAGMKDYPDVIVTTSRDGSGPEVTDTFKRDGLNVDGDEVYRECKFLVIKSPFG